MIRAKKAREVIIDPDSGKKKYIYGPQKHRRAWEKIPVLKEWLRPSQKADHYSYCSFCDKHLKANRRSLLDHAKSRVHLDMMPGGPGRPGRRRTMNNVLLPDDGLNHHGDDPLYDGDDDIDDYDDSYIEGNGFEGNGSNFVTTEMHNDYEDDDDEIDIDTKEGILLQDSEEDDKYAPAPSVHPMVQINSDTYNGGTMYQKTKSPSTPSFANRSSQNNPQQIRSKNYMSKFPVSTHILDTMNGVPAQGVSVTLSRFHEDDWTVIGSGITNQDGRYQEFLPREYFIAGRYKIHFYVEDYFKKLNKDFFYPFIEIVFDVKNETEHFHIPLLLTAFGYTTYRGS